MRLAGQRSWQSGVDEPQVLVIALYVRDTAGLARHDARPARPTLAPDTKQVVRWLYPVVGSLA